MIEEFGHFKHMTPLNALRGKREFKKSNADYTLASIYCDVTSESSVPAERMF
jgi:hypothetical protein